jgi:hypothetical protein
VGLFPGRILEAPPITSTVIADAGSYALTNVPAGTWYLLAHATAINAAPPAAYIGAHGPALIQPGITAHLADIHLRPRNAIDPPVLMAIPATTSYHADAAS